MHFDILTLFPEGFRSFFSTGMMARAVDTGLVDYRLVNMRQFGQGNYRSVDDAPYGGGAGMLLKYEVIRDAVRSLQGSQVIYLSPRGRPLDQRFVETLASRSQISLLCGHYEGIDQRALDSFVTDECSIGDYVLNGGEGAAQILVEAVSRKIPGYLTKESLDQESFNAGLLEHDQFTRPREIDGRSVPEVLAGGDPKGIRSWERMSSLERTHRTRPDLFRKQTLSVPEFEGLQERILKRHRYANRDEKNK